MPESALSRRVSEFVGVALFTLSLIWVIALGSYSPADPVWYFKTAAAGLPANFAGRIGAFMSEASFQLMGYAAWVAPIAAGAVGWNAFWCHKLDAAYTKLVGAFLMVSSVAGLLALVFHAVGSAPGAFPAGGALGEWFSAAVSEYLNAPGATIFLCLVLTLSVILSTQFSFGRALTGAGRIARLRGASLAAAWKERRAARRRDKERQQIVDKHVKKAGRAGAPEIATKAEGAAAALKAVRTRAAAGGPKLVDQDDDFDDDEDDEDDDGDAPALASPRATTPPSIKRPAASPVPGALPFPSNAAAAESPKPAAARRKGAYVLPPLTLLDAPKDHRKIDERALMDAAKLLEEKCREFSVEGTVVQIHPGPVVTTYEFKPDAGVKYSRITGLMEDLCLAMQAESVLIDRIAGKSTVGIQIPNPNRETICLRELLETDAYTRSTPKLTMAMGKTIHGEPFVSDMATMPHLLIAGSTGAGKSVSVNAMISSILFRCTPDDVRFIMIDPKRLELGMYEDIPHLLTPVVVDPKQAANALRWAVHEMEERYKTLAAQGVRNIEQYNRNLRAMILEQGTAAGKPAADGDTAAIEPLKTMPYVVVIIDELADLMMCAGKEVEESIARLAQMARAVGIHLILATQRPSVDVITGLIKANLPARIAFRVATKIDSRTILDGNGAEQLLGKGDMLYLPPASSRFIRIHGPYISEQETARLCSFLRKQGKPIYDNTIVVEEKAAERMEFEKDDLYDEAARIVVSSGQASISYLQRRLRIGFSRAARLIDMMEMDGVVSAATNGKREVLVDSNYFEAVDAQLR